MTQMTEIMKDILKKKIIQDIESIAKGWGIETVDVEFDTLKTIFINLPFKENNDTSNCQAEFIIDLMSKGYKISMVFAHKKKGLRMFGMVKKQV